MHRSRFASHLDRKGAYPRGDTGIHECDRNLAELLRVHGAAQVSAGGRCT